MNNKEFSLIEINDDKPIKEWAAELMGAFHKDAIESIRRENVSVEDVFYVELDGKKYLAFCMEGEMLPADMSMTVNQKHRAVMKAIRVKRTDGQLLYSLRAENPK